MLRLNKLFYLYKNASQVLRCILKQPTSLSRYYGFAAGGGFTAAAHLPFLRINSLAAS